MSNLPDWLISYFVFALIGEIYPNIRAIAVKYNNKEVLIRYYLDREETDFDRESIEVVATNLSCSAPSHLLVKIDVECVFSKNLIRDLESLDGFIYARREYDMDKNPAIPDNTLFFYFKDLVHLIKEKSIQAKTDFDLAVKYNEKDYSYKTGYLMAFHEIISIMKDQADAFGIDKSDLGLDDINPEKDLV